MKTKLSVHRFPGTLVLVGITAVVFTAIPPKLHAQAPAASAPQLPPTVANMKGKTAGQFYKNVKVLKDIPAAEIHPAMEYITTALGVPCEYCHVFPNLDSDERREKNVARGMMKMTIALNATVFDGKREITCFTCHRGATKGAPALVFPGETSPTEIFPTLAVGDITSIDSSMSPSKAPATVVSGPPVASKAAAASASLPTVDNVFSKYEQALGGSAIGKVRSLVEKGTVEMLVPPPPQPPGTPPIAPTMGTVPAEIDRKLPGKALLSVQFPGRPPRMEGMDGTMGWTNAPLREKTGGELVLQEEFAEFPPGLKFKESHTAVQVDAIEKIGDREAYRVVGIRSDGSAIDRLYFDAQNGLLLRTYSTMQSALGGFPEETNYDDYREAGGVKVPFTMRVLSPLGNQSFTWSQVDVNASVEDSRFTMPPPPPPPPARPKPVAN
jgi:photosynthetic reaction center cytochrome c subunit